MNLFYPLTANAKQHYGLINPALTPSNLAVNFLKSAKSSGLASSTVPGAESKSATLTYK